ncbi:MAG: glycosyltransferase family 61 protein [Pseudomonadota bacterium]
MARQRQLFDPQKMTEFELTSFSNWPYKLPNNVQQSDVRKFKVEPLNAEYHCKLRNEGKLLALDGGYLLRNGWDVSDLCLGAEGERKLPSSLVWRARLKNFLTFERRRWSDVVWPTRRPDKTVFGWLVWAMPKLYLLNEMSIDIPVILPAEYRRIKRIRDSLEAFDRLDFEFVERDFVGVLENCWMVDSCSYSKGYNRVYNRAVLKEMSRYLIEKFAISPTSGSERVYISRQRSRRKISNGEEIEQILAKSGFQTVFLEDNDFRSQMELLANARAIISVHGAGLGNMLFAPEGAVVIELTHSAIPRHFGDLADALGHEFYYLNGEPSKMNSGKIGLNSDLNIDATEIGKLLEQTGFLRHN